MNGNKLRFLSKVSLTFVLHHSIALDLSTPSPERSNETFYDNGHSAESSSKRLVIGIIPFWVAAVVVSCLSSFLVVGGFVLQKIAVRELHNKCPWPKVGDIVLSPKWVLGFFLAIVLPMPAALLAYALAPMSLLAPLSGFTILVNFVMAPKLLGEHLQCVDMTASVLILSGTVLTTLTGDHGNESVKIDLDRMRSFFLHGAFVVAFSCLIITIVFTLTCTYVWRHAIEEAAALRPTNPPVHEMLLPAWLYAAFGCLTNIGLKAMAEFMTAGVPLLLVGIYALVVVAPFGWLQLNFLNRGQRLYLQVIIFPMSSALLVATNTFYGAIFYQEYTAFRGSPARIIVFTAGVVLIMMGINAFQFRQMHKAVKVFPTVDEQDVSTEPPL